MIGFYKEGNTIIFSYTPSYTSTGDWVEKSLQKDGEITFKKTFTFRQEHVYIPPATNNKGSESDDEISFDFEEEYITSHFLFARKKGKYYKVIKGILIDKWDIYFHEDMALEKDFFIADTDISVFKMLQPLLTSDLYVGGDQPTALGEKLFQEFIANFPNAYEKKKYMEARISAVLRDSFENLKDGEQSYHQYLNKKLSRKGSNLKKTFRDTEMIKYQTIFEKLTEMLNNEERYSEKQWQEEILQIIQLIYPKYIFAFREVPIKDSTIQERFLDYMLVDAGGYTDIVEIKRPFGKAIITENTYRNNFIPLRELSGTIMQIEKYIYYLNRWGRDGEKYLTEKYKNELPSGFEIKITNPSGIIIMGRDNTLRNDQKADFEVVKRKYKNVVDIITYDNLLERLKYTIDQIQKS